MVCLIFLFMDMGHLGLCSTVSSLQTLAEQLPPAPCRSWQEEKRDGESQADSVFVKI